MEGDFPSSIAFLAKKNGRLVVSDAGFIYPPFPEIYGPPESEPFSGMVPGWIGDPRAGYDSVYGGIGWRYVDDRDFVVYSGLDYDSNGVDISGNNYNDWPIRMVQGKRTYVSSPSERSIYPPVFRSDEDMFCVFKDTDTRFDRWYDGPGGRSEPIGLEVLNSIYSWGQGPGKDIVLFQYDIINKSQSRLDSCYIVYSHGLIMVGRVLFPDGFPGLKRTLGLLETQNRKLPYFAPSDPTEWIDLNWVATEVAPTIGFPVLDAPPGYGNIQLDIHQVGCNSSAIYFTKPPPDSVAVLQSEGNDSIAYRTLVDLKLIESSVLSCETHPIGPVVSVGPFPMEPNDTARVTFAIIFSDSLPHLLLMHDFITRVYNNSFARPSPPPTPELTATGLNRSVKLSWDNTAESATDIIIPDSLGRPFVGYKLLRATSRDGPYVELARWQMDTLVVYEYLDTGEDLEGGLKNNMTYYYQLLSYDEGAVRLKLDPMESPAVEGVNAVSVIPTTEPSDATSEGSDGSLVNGNLGGVSVPVLKPTNTTNFNRLLSGRDLTLKLSATSNGIGYTLPVTITDSISGREHNDVVDPDLLVHGSPESAGPRGGTATIEDVFDIGAADITFSYSFEQLAEPFHVTPAIEGGSDCPILIGDSLGITGLKLSDPYTSQGQELSLEFSEGGIDTGSTIFQRYFPYLTVRLIDISTGKDYAGQWSLTATGVRRTGGTGFNPGRTDRYYLTGEISNGETWDFGHLLELYNWAIAFDFADHGVGSGKPIPTFSWPSTHTEGTIDFKTGDRVTLSWEGGVSAVFPEEVEITLTGAPGGRTDVTEEMMEGVRIVPNPYFVHHEAQRTSPELYFNYLPEECTIRIYTLALDLVKTITHTQGSREHWNLTTEGGQLVASQMLIAHIEATNGAKTVKKFAVVVGK